MTAHCTRCQKRTFVFLRSKPAEGVPFVDCGRGGHVFKDVPGDEKLLRHLYEAHHASPFEFAGMTIDVQAPIMCFREWHRHRTQSYSERSARYAPLPALDYLPTPERCMMLSKQNKQAGALKGSEELTLESALETDRHPGDDARGRAPEPELHGPFVPAETNNQKDPPCPLTRTPTIHHASRGGSFFGLLHLTATRSAVA